MKICNQELSWFRKIMKLNFWKRRALLERKMFHSTSPRNYDVKVSRVSLLFPHHDTCLNICFPHESLLHDLL